VLAFESLECRAGFGARCPRRTERSATGSFRNLNPLEGETHRRHRRHGEVARLQSKTVNDKVLAGSGSGLQVMSLNLIYGRLVSSTPFSHRPASGEVLWCQLRRCTSGGIILVPLLGVSPSV
jgi:hypothetical protein